MRRIAARQRPRSKSRRRPRENRFQITGGTTHENEIISTVNRHYHYYC